MKEKILVVDDDKSMVNMIKDVLEMEGYFVFYTFRCLFIAHIIL